MTAGVRVAVLGPLELTVGAPVALGPKQRGLVALLAVAGGPVAASDLLGALWGDDAGARAAHALQQQVSSVRKLVEPPRVAGGAPVVLRTAPGGYVLDAETDLGDFRRTRREGDERRRAGDDAAAAESYAAALALWRGDALADVRAANDHLERVAAGLDEERMACTEAWARAWLDVDPAAVVADLERLVRAHPWREGLRASLMRALYRCGRQADALAAYAEGRRVLAEELGLDPGPELRELEAAILRHDPSLGGDTTVVVPVPARPPELYSTVRAGTTASLALVLPDGQVVVLDAAVPTGHVLVGRVPEAAVQLVDSRVSRRHAELSRVGTGWVVADLGSTNGTRVNGAPPSGDLLADGDVIDIGGVELRVVAGPR